MKKRSMVLVTSLLLAVLIVAGGTFAWFTASTPTKTNSFQAGKLALKLVDKFDERCAQNVNPGDCYFKQVYVENTGTKRAVVRVKADMAFGDPALSTSVVDVSVNPNWFLKQDSNGDWYYYYRWVLNPGSKTADLINGNKVCFKGCEMGNEYQGQTFEIEVKAEGIQATHQAPWHAGWNVGVYWLGTTVMRGEGAPQVEVMEDVSEAQILEWEALETVALGEATALDVE